MVENVPYVKLFTPMRGKRISVSIITPDVCRKIRDLQKHADALLGLVPFPHDSTFPTAQEILVGDTYRGRMRISAFITPKDVASEKALGWLRRLGFIDTAYFDYRK